MIYNCFIRLAKGDRLQYSAPVDALNMLSDDDHYPDRS